jgi:hypothetical protein
MTRASIGVQVDFAGEISLHPTVDEVPPCHTLAHRLLRHQGAFFAFVRTAAVAPANNRAARTLRPVVSARKSSGGARSPAGTTTRLTMARLCATWLARGLDPFQDCLALLRQQSSLTHS